MRKFFAISLLSLIFISQLGYYFFYSGQVAEAKEEMNSLLKAEPPANKCHIIIWEDNSANIRWQEKGKEFLLNGNLYDVAKTEIQNGKTVMYCLVDRKEEKVLQNYSKAVASTSDNTPIGKTGNHTVKFQLSDYILNITEKTDFITISSAIAFNHHDVSLSSSPADVTAPPPRA